MATNDQPGRMAMARKAILEGLGPLPEVNDAELRMKRVVEAALYDFITTIEGRGYSVVPTHSFKTVGNQALVSVAIAVSERE